MQHIYGNFNVLDDHLSGLLAITQHGQATYQHFIRCVTNLIPSIMQYITTAISSSKLSFYMGQLQLILCMFWSFTTSLIILLFYVMLACTVSYLTIQVYLSALPIHSNFYSHDIHITNIHQLLYYLRGVHWFQSVQTLLVSYYLSTLAS